MTGPRDWDKEMAEIDKIIASGKSAPVAPGAPAVPAVAGRVPAAPAPRASTDVVTRRRDKVGVWVRTLLGVAGATALPFWPYGKSCGTMLYLYLLSSVVVSLLGIWTMRGSWTHRRGVAHTIGMLVVIAGLAFAAFTVFQRTGLAAVRLGWTCP